MCDKDSYLLALYLITGSTSILTGGLFVLLAMGNVHKRNTLKERNEITKKNQTVLPTSTSVPVGKSLKQTSLLL